MIDDQDLTIDTFISSHEINLFESKMNDLTDLECEPQSRKPEHSLGGPDFRTAKAKREENESIDLFQKTGNIEILETVYKNRVPTLKWWANKNKYLDHNSFDDVFGELTKIFVRSIYSYKYIRDKIDKDGLIKKVKTPFNSYLFSALDNSMCNLHNRKKAKKRCTSEMENADGSVESISAILLSLNFSYSEGSDGDFTLQDVIPDDRFGMDGRVTESICFTETVSALCCKDDPHYIREAFIKLGEGSSLASIIKEHNSHTGKMKIENELAEKLKKENNVEMVNAIICEKQKNKKFKLLDYEICGQFIDYRIEFQNTKESELIIKKIRALRKNKDALLKKINCT